MAFERVKLYNSGSFPQFIFDWFVNAGIFVEDGIWKYEIGRFTKETLKHAQEAKEKNLPVYSTYCEQYCESAEIDKWFLENGAGPEEVVYIKHY